MSSPYGKIDPEKQYIVIQGNLADGFTFTGPFNDRGEATEYAEQYLGGDTWWIDVVWAGGA